VSACRNSRLCHKIAFKIFIPARAADMVDKLSSLELTLLYQCLHLLYAMPFVVCNVVILILLLFMYFVR
jgi:hypothetical protein